ncbi:hypothetical protein [Mesorhizobium captivum]|uniref:hypothetical protein n=1 Tax=Mesorhizobium captivum TaxID=3072319 RepID=UPI002A242C8C|nr:hypothetical protein [Mesorhizobium sp. VK22E]MDX8508459.1 hypothetical protein [Mesorhizobium sp. VK22E]
MADNNQYSPIIKGIFVAQMLVGSAFVCFWLWAGQATIPKHGGGFQVLDRSDDPFLYWLLLLSIAGALIALPLWHLHKGSPKR